MSAFVGVSKRVGGLRVGAYHRVSRDTVEEAGVVALALLLGVILWDLLRVAAWLVVEVCRLSWKAVRWCWRRERAEKAAGVALIALALGVALAPARASADPDDSTPGVDAPSPQPACVMGQLQACMPYWRSDVASPDCFWLGGAWRSNATADGRCPAVGAQ